MYPALAVAAALQRQKPDSRIVWIGTGEGMEADLVPRAGLTFESIAASGLRGRNPLAAVRSAVRLGRGFWQSRRLLRRLRPDVLFVTGGYVCVPVTLAARQMGIPVVIYLPDIEPGLAIKFLARFASRVAVTTPEAQTFFRPGLTVVTGYPVRPELETPPSEAVRAEARRRLGLTGDLPVLLVFGGSRGARSINRALTAHLEPLLEVCQIVHVTGRLDEAWVLERRANLPADRQARYRVSAYLHDEMPLALQAADLVVSRAGASTLGEFPAVGLPAVLVPYPYAGAHQARNADYLAKHGAAVVIQDNLLAQKLGETVLELLKHPEKLSAMRRASQKLAVPGAALHLARLIQEVGTYAD